MTNCESSATEAAWPFARNEGSDIEVAFDPYEIDWQIDELTSEFRMEFDRGLRTGVAIVTSLRGLSQDTVLDIWM